MKLALTRGDNDFRREIGASLERVLPRELRDKGRRNLPFTREESLAWQRILDQQGYGAPSWPVEYGGTGWSLLQRYIFTNEMIALDAPRQSPYGLNMVGPVIYTYGSEAQKQRYLPGIRQGRDWWCQGYSEAEAGSDLAALRTRAVLDGAHYIINGHKIWTSTAHEAHLMFALVRTSKGDRPQEGISFIIIDMDSPGLSVRPIHTIDESHSLNEVTFDNVRVPTENLIGEPGRGWSYAKFLLGHERLGIADIPRSKKRLARLKAAAQTERAGAVTLAEDPIFAAELARVEIDLMMLEYTALRLLAQAGSHGLGPEVSILKIRGSEIGQRVTELAVESLGHFAARYEHENWKSEHLGESYEHARGFMQSFLHYRAATIYGGTNEVLKNVLAKRVLEL